MCHFYFVLQGMKFYANCWYINFHSFWGKIMLHTIKRYAHMPNFQFTHKLLQLIIKHYCTCAISIVHFRESPKTVEASSTRFQIFPLTIPKFDRNYHCGFSNSLFTFYLKANIVSRELIKTAQGNPQRILNVTDSSLRWYSANNLDRINIGCFWQLGHSMFLQINKKGLFCQLSERISDQMKSDFCYEF